MSNLTIYKDNYLIEASYKLTLIEQRLMIYCISRLNPEKPQRELTISVEDFINQFPDMSKKHAYAQIKQAIDSIGERWIKVKDPKRTKEFRWISSKEYYHDHGSAAISFSTEVMPYLCQLEKQFTKYQLRNISAFKRVYSIRLYELLTQYRTLKSRIVSVLDLRIALKLDDKFPEWFEFKRNVVDSSIKEINEKSDLLIEYELIRKGRSIDSIKFLIKEKSKIKQVQQAKKSVNEQVSERNETMIEVSSQAQKYLDEIKDKIKKR